MAGWWAYTAADGRKWNYAKEPTFRCPLAEAATYVTTDDELSGAGEWRITLSTVETAAVALDCDPMKLARMLVERHRRSSGQRARVDGKLTDYCESCGARMVRLGFHCWIDEPVPEDELTGTQRVGAKINQRLGFSGEQRRTIRSFYVDTKKEAKAWAYEEYKTAKAALA